MGKNSLFINLSFLYGPLIVGVLISGIAYLLPDNVVLSSLLGICLYFFGSLILFFIKLTQFKSGILIAFGTSKMVLSLRPLYYLSYLLIVIGFLTTLAFLINVSMAKELPANTSTLSPNYISAISARKAD